MTDSLRILVITNLYPPHSYGGYEDLCAGVVTAWRGAGHVVEVLTSERIRPDVDVPADEPDTSRVLPLAWSEHRFEVPRLRTQLRDQRRTRDVVAARIAHLKPDVVSVWNPGALALAALFATLDEHGVPVVAVVGDRWLVWGPRTDPWSGRFDRAPWRAVRGAVTRLTGVPTSSRRVGRRMVALFASRYLQRDAEEASVWPLDETAVVPHGPDLDRYPPVDVDVARPALSGRLLYIGRVAPEKGVATAVRALARLPDHHLDVFGAATPGFAAELRRLADGAGVSERLQLHGSAGPDRLRAAYDAADVLVFPSSWPEPFGIVPLEAMSRGAPVIATGTGGSGELLVEGLTALRFDAGDDAGLARRVHELADAPDTAATLRRNGVALARWLSRDRVSAELERWHWFAAGRAGRPSQRPLLPPELGSGG